MVVQAVVLAVTQVMVVQALVDHFLRVLVALVEAVAVADRITLAVAVVA
jgi:hypothetical protein